MPVGYSPMPSNCVNSGSLPQATSAAPPARVYRKFCIPPRPGGPKSVCPLLCPSVSIRSALSPSDKQAGQIETGRRLVCVHPPGGRRAACPASCSAIANCLRSSSCIALLQDSLRRFQQNHIRDEKPKYGTSDNVTGLQHLFILQAFKLLLDLTERGL